MRLVLDTNVIISGLISPGGTPARLLDLWDEDQRYSLISAEEQIVALQRVANYPKLRARLQPALLHDWVFTLRRFGLLQVDLPTIDISPNPNDNFLLAIAEAGHADLLVTGDKRDLLALKHHGRTAIVSARGAVDRLQGCAL